MVQFGSSIALNYLLFSGCKDISMTLLMSETGVSELNKIEVNYHSNQRTNKLNNEISSNVGFLYCPTLASKLLSVIRIDFKKVNYVPHIGVPDFFELET